MKQSLFFGLQRELEVLIEVIDFRSGVLIHKRKILARKMKKGQWTDKVLYQTGVGYGK